MAAIGQTNKKATGRLRRLSIWLDTEDLDRLASLIETKTAGTKVSMLIRQSISEYLERNEN